MIPTPHWSPESIPNSDLRTGQFNSIRMPIIRTDLAILCLQLNLGSMYSGADSTSLQSTGRSIQRAFFGSASTIATASTNVTTIDAADNNLDRSLTRSTKMNPDPSNQPTCLSHRIPLDPIHTSTEQHTNLAINVSTRFDVSVHEIPRTTTPSRPLSLQSREPRGIMYPRHPGFRIRFRFPRSADGMAGNAESGKESTGASDARDFLHVVFG